ncbi:MAG: DUF2497 domain-containing protein [Acetobacteraceae bacterium]
MSGAQTPPTGSTAAGPAPAAGAAAPAGDPSMEDILASIRRILSEDETAPAATAAAPSAEAKGTEETPGDGVLVLDPAMLVPEPAAAPPPAIAPAPVEPVPIAEITPVLAVPPDPMPPVSPNLVAPEAAAAAASSVGSLMRTLAAERTMQVRSGGPTIEDIVREEIRPMLKLWLDTNLPPLVERLVRAEIERVVGRAVP